MLLLVLSHLSHKYQSNTDIATVWENYTRLCMGFRIGREAKYNKSENHRIRFSPRSILAETRRTTAWSRVGKTGDVSRIWWQREAVVCSVWVRGELFRNTRLLRVHWRKCRQRKSCGLVSWYLFMFLGRVTCRHKFAQRKTKHALKPTLITVANLSSFLKAARTSATKLAFSWDYHG